MRQIITPRMSPDELMKLETWGTAEVRSTYKIMDKGDYFYFFAGVRSGFQECTRASWNTQFWTFTVKVMGDEQTTRITGWARA